MTTPTPTAVDLSADDLAHLVRDASFHCMGSEAGAARMLKRPPNGDLPPHLASAWRVLCLTDPTRARSLLTEMKREPIARPFVPAIAGLLRSRR